MKVLICLLYNLCVIVYFNAPNTRFWKGFNIGTLCLALMFAFITMLSAQRYKVKPALHLLICYSVGSTFVRCMYTLLCVPQQKTWVYEHTTWFTIAYEISFAITIFISILLYYKKNYDYVRFY